MTILDTPITPIRFRPVVLDMYRGVHKGIRSELFAVVGEAGRVDPADDSGLAALAGQVQAVAHFLGHHAATEDAHIGPVLDEQLPHIAERIADEHESFERRLDGLRSLAEEVRSVPGSRNAAVHELYIELASFAGGYLLHQDFEERVINPMLEETIGVAELVRINDAIIGTMEPQELMKGLAAMLPAMNIDDRAGLLGGMRANAPEPVFAAVWSLAGSVLTPFDRQAVAQRLGIG